MGRPKKVSSEEMVKLLEAYYESDGCGDPSRLKFSKLEIYAAGQGIKAKAYDFKRDAKVRQRIRELEQEHEILLEQQMDTAYKTLDIEGILKKCRTVDDIITALQGMDDYWKRTCEHAFSVINRDKKFMSEKASYESRVRKMEQELEECQKKIQDIQADAKRYEQENIYLRRILKTHLYPALANELLRESNLPVPNNTSVRPESFEKLIDGKLPSAFEGAQGVSEKKPDWKERLQNALECQVDKNGR